MPDFTVILHWIPSHIKHGYAIPGNQIADQLADHVAKSRTAATHAEFSYKNHCEILNEVMSLIGDIERLFPLKLDGPGARQRAVARRAKPRRRRKRRLCDVP